MAPTNDSQIPRSRSVLALIPARGGSKGIPGKNLAPLADKPLLLHSLEHARATPAIDRIVVSTDDDKIAHCAAASGAEVVRRPAELASDTASSETALLHALDYLRSTEGYEPDLVVFLQATSPLRESDAISRAIAKLDAEQADSLFSACPVHGFVWRRNAVRLEALTYDFEHRPRRQDIGEDLLENGSIYIFKPWVLRQRGNRLGGKVAVFEMPHLDSFQVDEPGDLELMEQLFRIRPRRGPRPDLSAVRLLVLDFDGVLTDNRVLVHQDGNEAVRCDRGDGLGLERLRRDGRVQVVVLSKEKNPVVAARCEKLRIPCFHGYDDKLSQLRKIAAKRRIEASEIAYVGNDLNDLEVMAGCGTAIAVADAEAEVLAVADFITARSGGRGAVREVCEWLLAISPGPFNA